MLVGKPNRRSADRVDFRPSARLDILKHGRLAAGSKEQFAIIGDPLVGIEDIALGRRQLTCLASQAVDVAQDSIIRRHVGGR